MTITDTMSITMRKADNSIEFVNDTETYIITPADPRYVSVKDFYNSMKSLSILSRENAINDGIIAVPDLGVVEVEAEPVPVEENRSAKEILIKGLDNLINFFSEFDFVPSFRFINTLSYAVAKSKKNAKAYISNYFSLTDSAYATEIKEKIKSAEFNSILNDIAQYGQPANTINSRMKVYYGPAGTGKTTIAQTETDNRCIVCNASMLPADLMEDFIFNEGQPTFNPSVLCDCMEKGLPIVLDEINLLPFDSLRFLQGITDGKKTVTYKNRTINIADGFQIIGTMNLALGGAIYGLPEPLVDRCSEIKEFTLTADQLSIAIIGNRE
jgi:hypothetical protein